MVTISHREGGREIDRGRETERRGRLLGSPTSGGGVCCVGVWVWVAGEADHLQVRELGEEVVSPRHSHLRGNQVHLWEEREREREREQ